MLSTIVSGSLATLQLFALIAIVVFIVGGVVSVVEKAVGTALLFAGLTFVSLAFLFHP